MQGEFDGNSPSYLFTCADPGGVGVGQGSILGKGSPNGFAVTVGEKLRLIENFYARRFERGDGEFAVPFVYDVVRTIAIEDDAFQCSAGAQVFPAKVILIALAEGGLKIVGVCAKPSVHVGPGQHDGDGNRFVGGIFRMPAVDRDWIA